MGIQIKSPTSHISQTQEDEDEAVSSDKEEVVLEAIEVRDGPDLRVDLEVEEVDSPTGEDSREESLTKVLPPRDPEYLVKLKIKTKIKIKTNCYHCHQRGHFAAGCPEKNKGQTSKSSEGKKFEDYTYAYSGAEEPQLATATAIPQAYEDALAAMRQSLKNQDPLHGLNM